MKFIKSSFLFVAVISFGCIYPEYIIYKTENVGGREKVLRIDSEMHSKVYDILMRYQFPMNTNPVFNLKKELSVQDFELMDKDERLFLENKIKKDVNENLRVLFVPTTVYELFVLKRYMRDDATIFLSWQGGVHKEFDGSSLSGPEEFKKWDSFFRREHFLINRELFEFLGHSIRFDQGFTGNVSRDKWITFVEPLYFDFEKFFKINYTGKEEAEKQRLLERGEKVTSYKGPLLERIENFFYMVAAKIGLIKIGITRKDNIELLKKGILCECKAHTKGEFVMYRGCEPFFQGPDYILLDSILDINPDLLEVPRNFYNDLEQYYPKVSGSVGAYGVSYGISLFSSILFDTGKTPYSYIAWNCNFGYCGFINRHDWRTGDLHDIFDIPNLSTLESFCTSGYFAQSKPVHPVAKNYLDREHNRSNQNSKIATRCLKTELTFTRWLKDNFKIIYNRWRFRGSGMEYRIKENKLKGIKIPEKMDEAFLRGMHQRQVERIEAVLKKRAESRK